MYEILNQLMVIFIRIFFINLCMYYSYIKISNTKTNIIHISIIIPSSALLAALYVFIRSYLGIIPSIFIVYFLYNLLLSIIIKNKFNVAVIYTLVTLAISTITISISMIVIGPILYMINPNIENPIYYVIYGLFQMLLVFVFFKIRRFRKGFEFLQNNNQIKDIGGYVFIFIINVVLIINLLNIYWDSNQGLATYIVAEFLIVGVIIVLWIWRGLSAFYQENIRERYVKEQKEEINRLKLENEKLSSENESFSKIIHKYSKTLASMDSSIRKIVENTEISENIKTEFAEEYGDILDNIKNISKDFSNEVLQNKIKDKNIEATNIYRIDSILNYMLEESIKNNIDFDVKINGSIHLMVENVISEDDLATLLGDHIENAIIAINNSKSSNRSILVLLGIIESYYQIWIYDGGIEFNIETLLNLGLRRITTHEDTEGSGIGFMTSFEILKKTGASLIIEENKFDSADYTKIVKIKFDGKNDYRIVSYRADEIREKVHGDRIDIESKQYKC